MIAYNSSTDFILHF